MPIYPGRRKGTWRVTVWKGGRQHEQIVEGRETDARDHEARLRLELRTSPESLIRRRTDPLFSVFCAEDYEPHARTHLGANTWRNGRCYMVATLAAFFGRYRLSEITPPLVTEYTATRARTVKASTVNLELRVLAVIWKFAIEDCRLQLPKLRVRKLKEERRRVHVWTLPEQSRLLRVCRRKDPELEPLVAFMLETGCRKGEALAAPWSWVDRRRRLLCVGPTDYWTPKNRHAREVPITAALAKLLARLPRETPWIFPNVHGDRYVRFPYTRYRRVVRAAKLRGGPHTCRHSFASGFLDAGGTLQDLAAMMGHSLTKTTELYVHLLPSHLARARHVLETMATAG